MTDGATRKQLLVVYHSQTGRTERLVGAAVEGCRDPAIEGVATACLRALEAGPEDLIGADGLLVATPENFGYLAGAMKDFFDRTYYPAQGRVEGLPFAVIISAGNDGSGALRALRRIASGFPLREVQEPVIVRGEPADPDLRRCRELGMTLAAALELGAL